MTRNTWIIFTAVVVLLFGTLIYFSTKDAIDVSKVNENSVLSASKNSGNIGDRVYGNKDAKVILVEYGDYQCPGCKSAYEPLKTVSEKYKGQLAFVFRNFPLTSIHPNARAAAAVAEAAGEDGKFWEMHDKLYENQTEWSSASSEQRTKLFTSYAIAIGINEAAFTSSLKSKNESINQKIGFDLALGQKIGVDGTPGIFLGGKQIDQKVVDGKLVGAAEAPKDAPSVWGDPETFDSLILQPAFKAAGVDVSKVK